MLPQLIAQHEMAKAQFEKLDESRRRLEAIRTQMDSLGKLGDLVEAEDVIKAGGHLVAAGLSPMALARLMSDMPDSGPELAGWLAKHEAEVSRREELLRPALESAKFQAGVAAMRVLMGHHFAPPGQLGAEAPAARQTMRASRGLPSPSAAPGSSLLPQQTLVEPSTPAPPNALAAE